jgi:hypothetical protein
MILKYLSRNATSLIALSLVLVSLITVLLPGLTAALPAGSFGSGTFGNCNFGSCSITISTSGSSGCSGAVCLNLTPTSSGSCTTNSDTVTVQTQYSGGYSLSLGNTNTSSALSSGSNSIAATSGTYSSPTQLTTNTWGYRLDGVGSFGVGTTSQQTNVSVSSLSGLTFAQTEVSSNTPDNIANTTSPSSPSGDNYSVWYGVCADNTTPYGSYSSSVTYTAVTN